VGDGHHDDKKHNAFRMSKSIRRCFLCDIKDASSCCVRVMGLIVSIVQESSLDANIVLDDGTALVALATPPHMLSAATVGTTVDCVASKVSDKLRVETLIVVQDVHATTLRWFELTYRKKSEMSMKFGYPAQEIDSTCVFELIQSEAGDSGVSLEDLASVLDLEPEHLKDMILELQLSGQVYQNRQGAYMPL